MSWGEGFPLPQAVLLCGVQRHDGSLVIQSQRDVQIPGILQKPRRGRRGGHRLGSTQEVEGGVKNVSRSHRN